MAKICPNCLEVVNEDTSECLCGRKFRETELNSELTNVVTEDKLSISSIQNEIAIENADRKQRLLRVAGMENDERFIPAPLADPLVGLRRGLVRLNWLTGWLVACGALLNFALGNISTTFIMLLSGVVGLLWVYGISRLLPDRPTDIIYLRSFRTDDETSGIRTSLERAVDPRLRVSGIRDPKRRWPKIVRFMSYILFALKYANPKYLNLEAGDEWKARLWRSLGEAKGVVIDIADLTTAVKAEIRLCAKCVELNRILFVVRESATLEVWANRILDVLDGAEVEGEIQIAVWHSHGWDRREFESCVKQFGLELPKEAAGFDFEARTLAEQLPGQEFRESNSMLGAEIAVGILFGFIGTASAHVFLNLNWGIGLFTIFFLLIWCIMFFVHYISFRRNSGSHHRRQIAFWIMFTLITISLALPIVDLHFEWLSTAHVRMAADQMRSKTNLKALAIAMANYESTKLSFPSANAPLNDNPNGKNYPVSWRVRLLPYLEHTDLFQQYRSDEPWDSSTNTKLLEKMPNIFRHPMADLEKVPIGYTHYRVFASRPGTQPSAMFVDGLAGPHIGDINDEISNTILIIETDQAVPWTMPEILLFDRNQPLPKLGGLYTNGYHAAMCDGSVRYFGNTMPEKNLRALITKDGGEVVKDD
jgi:hypothetical protein